MARLAIRKVSFDAFLEDRSGQRRAPWMIATLNPVWIDRT
jgi:hypothetical protein